MKKQGEKEDGTSSSVTSRRGSSSLASRRSSRTLGRAPRHASTSSSLGRSAAQLAAPPQCLAQRRRRWATGLLGSPCRHRASPCRSEQLLATGPCRLASPHTCSSSLLTSSRRADSAAALTPARGADGAQPAASAAGSARDTLLAEQLPPLRLQLRTGSPERSLLQEIEKRWWWHKMEIEEASRRNRTRTN
nr:unnamed protein product [Digitaria exilis]